MALAVLVAQIQDVVVLAVQEALLELMDIITLVLVVVTAGLMEVEEVFILVEYMVLQTFHRAVALVALFVSFGLEQLAASHQPVQGIYND
jgi:hypothetical protein